MSKNDDTQTASEEWYWSEDEERWPVDGGPHATRESAMAAARDELDDKDKTFYVGRAVRRTAGAFLREGDIERLLDGLNEHADELVGEVAGDWPHGSMSESARDRLEEAIRGAIEACAGRDGWQPFFYGIKDVRAVYPDACTSGEESV